MLVFSFSFAQQPTSLTKKINKRYSSFFGNCVFLEHTLSEVNLSNKQKAFLQSIGELSDGELVNLLNAPNEHLQFTAFALLEKNYPESLPQPQDHPIYTNMNVVYECSNEEPVELPFSFLTITYIIWERINDGDAHKFIKKEADNF